MIEGESAVLFVWRGPGIYEVHLALAERGRAAIEITKRFLGQVDARMFWAAIPLASRKVRLFARWMGWESQGMADLPHGRCELFISEN